ncbi:M42 family metallopeptidase [Mycoplasma sp. 'Moose RK']|uniref:M42 family metallopeptidase n=1 Tax=Mycoplasma sp. 'Moose RK' TaxID=2780095 RepID=UPI0018C2DE41|nr:M42 family metallopeptidase [Mycoplasma sp. 'Moose RK']MBG0730586.1 M42 family metallopeptidase [Mycoplasma sp. 'Moose RK']
MPILKKLKSYCDIDGMSRYEEEVVDQLKKSTKNLDLVYRRDGFGSLIMEKKHQNPGPKIVVAAHMDEVGFIVLDITEKGFIKVKSIGGIWGNIAIGAKFKLISSTGKEFFGIAGHTSIHIMERQQIEKALLVKDLFFDFGFRSKKEAEDLGVEIGNRIYFNNSNFLMQNNDYFASKAIDNRAGVVVIDELAHRLANKNLKSNPILIGTVQEEVGLRGARAVSKMIDADVAFAIDTGAAHDTEGAIPGVQKLGAGVAIDIADGGALMDPRLVEILFSVAKEKNIPIYRYVSQGGGTDAEELQYSGFGTPTVSISIPQRYLHSTYGLISISDIKAAIDLIEAFILAFDSEKLEELKYK